MINAEEMGYLRILFGNDIEPPQLHTEESYHDLIQQAFTSIKMDAEIARNYNAKTLRRTSDMRAAHKDADGSIRNIYHIVKMCNEMQNLTPKEYIKVKNKEIIKDWVEGLLRKRRDGLIESLTNQMIDAES